MRAQLVIRSCCYSAVGLEIAAVILASINDTRLLVLWAVIASTHSINTEITLL